MDDPLEDLVFLDGTPIDSINDNSFKFLVFVKTNRISKDNS